jgi:hypothetical protein
MVPYTASDIKKDSADSPWLFWALPAASARALLRIVLFIAIREHYIRRGLQGPFYKYSYPLDLGHIVRTPLGSFPLLYNFFTGLEICSTSEDAPQYRDACDLQEMRLIMKGQTLSSILFY